MAFLVITVQWSLTERVMCEWPDDHNVAEFIEKVYGQIAEELAKSPSWGLETVEYGLFYLMNNGALSQLDDRSTAEQLNIRPAATLFFANIHNPWWFVTRHLCELELIDGCVVEAPEDGLMLNRRYLIDKLPTEIVEEQRTLHRKAEASPLNRVSRDSHCEIVNRDRRWGIRSHKLIYINGQRLPLHEEYLVDPGQIIILTLGNNGWNIKLRVIAQRQQLAVGGT